MYNSRPLPFIICTARFNENNDAGLSGIEFVEEEVEEDHPIAASQDHPQTSDLDNVDYVESGDDEADSEYGEAAAPSGSSRPLPPPPPNRPPAPKEGGGDIDGNIVEETTERTKPAVNSGSLKDMLNAQIRARGNGEEIPSNDDAPSGNRPPPLPPARNVDYVDQNSSTSTSNRAKVDEKEEEDEEDDDLFTTKDDPYSLFSSNRSSIKVRLHGLVNEYHCYIYPSFNRKLSQPQKVLDCLIFLVIIEKGAILLLP